MIRFLPKASAATSIRKCAPSQLPHLTRSVATTSGKKEGDISSVFVSLSGAAAQPLPPRFADVKSRLVAGHEEALIDSWHRLLTSLREEYSLVKALGSRVFPVIDFKEIEKSAEAVSKELKTRGTGIVRGVVSEEQALQWKEDIKTYVKNNPQTKAFPLDAPAVYELYWSPSQVAARAHPNVLKTQKFLLSHWQSRSPDALISTSHPVAYADRLRIRQPGDAGFALGPHVDGGSVERFEEDGYGRGKVYEKIWQGRWEDYNPWESSCRLPVVSDLHNGAGACSMFRCFQGWLAMSTTGPGEGTLLVNPLIKNATAYYLLRPFFEAKRAPDDVYGSVSRFLDSDNWRLETKRTSLVQGANPGHCQELNTVLHPHLELDQTMVHVPQVRPGDYVAWHCDSIHAVDKVHTGSTDSSVMYIPACPLTEVNAQYLVCQRQAFIAGTPGPDFPGGKGESDHIGRPTKDDVVRNTSVEAQRAMGLARFDLEERGLSRGDRDMLSTANGILGF